jgi:hypothetical protein
MRGFREFAQDFKRDGFCVVPVYDEVKTSEMYFRLNQSLYGTMPEYVYPSGGLFVRGGFGALGNSSSFHLPIVREMRRDAHEVAKQVFKEFMGPSGHFGFEQLIDRVRVLKHGAEIKEEMWHRDQTPASKNPAVQDGDLIFGGWISLNGNQKFSAIKGSHTLGTNRGGIKGFAPLSKEECAKYTEEKKRVLELGSPDDWYINVPPGHMLIFQQELIHEVVGGKHKGEEQLRLFTGWRITMDPTGPSFIKNIYEFFVQQGITNIKSDQLPDMYPDMPWSSTTKTREGLAKWSRETFQPYLLEKRSVKSGPCQGETHVLVPKHMYSLYVCSIKKQAQRIIDEETGPNDDERQAVLDAARIFVSEHPSVWAEKRLFNISTEGPLVWETDYFLIREENRTMMEPYTEEEMSMHKPTSLF